MVVLRKEADSTEHHHAGDISAGEISKLIEEELGEVAHLTTDEMFAKDNSHYIAYRERFEGILQKMGIRDGYYGGSIKLQVTLEGGEKKIINYLYFQKSGGVNESVFIAYRDEGGKVGYLYDRWKITNIEPLEPFPTIKKLEVGQYAANAENVLKKLKPSASLEEAKEGLHQINKRITVHYKNGQTETLKLIRWESFNTENPVNRRIVDRGNGEECLWNWWEIEGIEAKKNTINIKSFNKSEKGNVIEEKEWIDPTLAELSFISHNWAWYNGANCSWRIKGGKTTVQGKIHGILGEGEVSLTTETSAPEHHHIGGFEYFKIIPLDNIKEKPRKFRS